MSVDVRGPIGTKRLEDGPFPVYSARMHEHGDALAGTPTGG